MDVWSYGSILAALNLQLNAKNNRACNTMESNLQLR